MIGECWVQEASGFPPFKSIFSSRLPCAPSPLYFFPFLRPKFIISHLAEMILLTFFFSFLIIFPLDQQAIQKPSLS